MSDEIDLTGKAIVITGAGGGLGAAYARACAAHGATVLLTDIDEPALTRTVQALPSAVGIAGDIADADFVAEVADAAVRRCGGLSGWVNNAGLEFHESTDAIDPLKAELVLRVNLLGTILGTSAAARVMRRQGSGGSIVNVTSGSHLGMRHLPVYGATKGGIASFTYAAAVDLGEYGIRVNAIMPLASTRMTMAGDEHFAAMTGTVMDAATRLNSPDAVAPLVVYLLSERSTELTSQVIRFDGQTLSLLRHPAVDSEGAVQSQSWSPESVGEALSGPLASGLYRGGAFRSAAGRPT